MGAQKPAPHTTAQNILNFLLILLIILAGIVAVILIGGILILHFVASAPPIPKSTIGEYEGADDVNIYYFQDGVRLTKYHYYTQGDFSDNPYFRPVDAAAREEILPFIEDFAGSAAFRNVPPEELSETKKQIMAAYDYDISALSDTDYYYLTVRLPDYPILDYTLYLYDTESRTLYKMYQNR